MEDAFLASPQTLIPRNRPPATPALSVTMGHARPVLPRRPLASAARPTPLVPMRTRKRLRAVGIDTNARPRWRRGFLVTLIVLMSIAETRALHMPDVAGWGKRLRGGTGSGLAAPGTLEATFPAPALRPNPLAPARSKTYPLAPVEPSPARARWLCFPC